MKVTVEFIREKFVQFNKDYFRGELNEPEFKVMHTKHPLGRYHYRYCMWSDELIESVLSVSDYYDRPEKAVCNTIIHEMIHLYIRQNRIEDTRAHHGRVFKSIANEINKKGDWNIATTDSVAGCGLNDKTKVNDYYIAFFKTEDGRYFAISMNKNYVDYYINRFVNKQRYYQDVVVFKSRNDDEWASYPICRARVRGYYITESDYHNKSLNEEVIYKMEKAA